MKILHLISSGGLYGAETMVVALSKRLREEGHSSVIGVFHNLHSPNTDIADHARSSGLPVEILTCNGRIDARAVSRLRRLVRDQLVDAIHAHGYKADIYGYMANLGLRTPILSTCHNWVDNEFAAYLYGVLDRRIGQCAAFAQRQEPPRQPSVSHGHGDDVRPRASEAQ